MGKTKILAICGSLRTGSLNRKVLFNGIEALKELDCEVTYLDLRELQLPLYDGDLEEASGVPKGAQTLSDAIVAADGVIIGCPEYNGGITGVLKNAIDWASRTKKNPYPGKPILLVGTSPGWFGAVKSHMITRLILTHLKAIVVPSQVVVPLAEKSLDGAGKLVDPMHVAMLKAGCVELKKFSSQV